ncbi:MAG: Crp/Fnr family transcriptional regulator [Elusimicrobiales bacterium]|nr:Crp/Fnr family transcriptional regulator [Elusimicrobiales bacterium]HOJ87036.1 Crp/Fnr family transcriptional regulator [Elusimicrobiales bacterium]HOL63660.1 Crp/Fnr family transcriptional regulator [Elusimicrobiales bacterium]HPO95741.1 Crp/Fnr family transcriptional regulator [Elusimicrobiales bacterium]
MFLSQGENDMISKVFKNIELFNKLSDSDIKKLQKIGKIKKYKKGDIIFNKNEIGKTFFIVKSGEVKIFTSIGRKNKILSLIGEKNFFGELALLGVKYRTASAVCEKDSELYVISANEFQNFLFKHKDFMIKMLYIMAERLKRADEEIENLIFHNMFGRVTKFIYERYIQEKNEKIKISQQEIAKNIGTTRVPVNRIISHLKNKGIIECKREMICILKPEKIKKIVEGMR